MISLVQCVIISCAHATLRPWLVRSMNVGLRVIESLQALSNTINLHTRPAQIE